MKFHPDRNHTPGATDAFKTISGAYECLSNEVKKKNYDQFGTEETFQNSGFGQNSFNGFSNFQRNDMRNEEMDKLFEEFFGIRRQRGPKKRATNTNNNQNEKTDINLRNLCAILPILLFLLIPMLSGLFSNITSYNENQIFKFERDSLYNIEHSAGNGIVKFYLHQSYRNYMYYPSYKSEIEKKVIKSYYENLKNKCKFEKQEKVKKIIEIKKYQKGEERIKSLEDLEDKTIQSCQDLKSFLTKIKKLSK
jgi:curved DNA-binding protein CbpA